MQINQHDAADDKMNDNRHHKPKMGWSQGKETSNMSSLPPLQAESQNISQQPKTLRFRDPIESTPKRKSSRLPSLHRRESLLAYEPMVARFVKNGDKFFEGVKMNVSSKSIRSWEVLLSELSRRIDLPAGVRHIYTPNGGHRVTGLSQFEHQHTYVCASTEPFKRIDYKNVRNPDWKGASKVRPSDAGLHSIFSRDYFTTPVNLNVSISSLDASMRSVGSLNASFRSTTKSEEESFRVRRPSQRMRPMRLTSISEPGEYTRDTESNKPLSPPIPTKPVQITVYRNGPPPRQSVTIYLNRDAIKSWEDAKKLIRENLHSVNGCMKVYKLDGEEVQSLSQLWRAGTKLIAAGAEKFDIAEFLTAPLNTTLHSNGEKPTGTARPLQELTLKGAENQTEQQGSIFSLKKDITCNKPPPDFDKNDPPVSTALASLHLPPITSESNAVQSNHSRIVDSEKSEEVQHAEVETAHENGAQQSEGETSQDDTDTSNMSKNEEDNQQTQSTAPRENQNELEPSAVVSESILRRPSFDLSLIPKFPPTPISSDISPAVSPLESVKRPRALSLISTSSSTADVLDSPLFSTAQMHRQKLLLQGGFSVHPQTPQSEVSLGVVQSVVDMMLPRQISLFGQSDSSTLSSSTSSESQPCMKRTVGIQTEFVDDHLSTIIEPAENETVNTTTSQRKLGPKINSMETAASQTELTIKNLEESAMEARRNKQTRERYHVGTLIEEGNFVTLKQCKEKKTSREYTLRVINKAKVFGCEDLILREITIMKMLHHENILRVVDHWDMNDEHCLVMEQIEGTDLFDAILYCQHFNEADAAVAMRQLGLALVYLHANRIVHRDIKPENIFLTIDAHGVWMLKLGGFSLAAAVSEPLSLVCGNHYYRAPEMIRETGYGTKLDVWSAGVICYILLSGTMPFGRKSKTNMFANTLLGRFTFPSCYWSNVSKEAKDFIRHLLVVSPQQRFSSSQMLQHSWLKQAEEAKTQAANNSPQEESALAKKLREHLKVKAAGMRNAAAPILTVCALDQQHSPVKTSTHQQHPNR